MVSLSTRQSWNKVGPSQTPILISFASLERQIIIAHEYCLLIMPVAIALCLLLAPNTEASSGYLGLPWGS